MTPRQQQRSAGLAGASWIWLDQPEPKVHQHACFRRAFDLKRTARDAELAISADSDFVIWINGVEAGRGQWSDWPGRKSVTRLSVGASVRRGRNVIAVLAYHKGEAFSCYAPGPAGLLVTLRCGGETLVSDDAWKAREHPAFMNGPVPKVTNQLGFTESFDARLDDDWIEPGYDDRAWPAAAARDMKPELIERPAPMLRMDEPVRVRVVTQGDFVRTRSEGTVAQVVASDALTARQAWEVFGNESLAPGTTYSDRVPTASDFLRHGDDEWLELKPPDAGRDGRYLILDLGREEVGLLHFRLDAPAGAVLDIAHGEHLDDGRVRAAIGGRNFADRYTCRGGEQAFTLPFRRLGARYLEVHVSGFARPVRLSYVGLIPTPLPVERTGSFDAGDPLVARTLEISTRTLELCMHEHYEDCPWREQSLYAYDSRNQALYGYYAFGNYRFAAASFDLLGRGYRERDGLLELCAPAKIPVTIPMFSLAWLNDLADHWLFSGSGELFATFEHQIDAMLSRLVDRQDAETGLYREPDGEDHWDFFEWSEGLAGGAWGRWGESVRGRLAAPWNLYLHEALGSVAWMHEQAGRAAGARALRKRRAALGRAIGAAFWDPKRQLFASYLRGGKRSHDAQLTQALAMDTGVATAAQRTAILARLDDPSLVRITLSSMLYLVRALVSLGERGRRLASELISRHWDPMTFAGATTYWETALGADDFAAAGSLCHGWSALPIYWYHACVLGVRPLEPGFRRFVIDPSPGRFAHARGTVPTPAGPIRVSWERTPRGIAVGATGPRGLQPICPRGATSIAHLAWNGRGVRG